MARVITLSRKFPSYHPKSGQDTHFVEKIYKALGVFIGDGIYPDCKVFGQDIRSFNSQEVYYPTCDLVDSLSTYSGYEPKYHTVRAGKRWKTGDMCSLRVWSKEPYKSKQILIAPDFELPRVADVEIDGLGYIHVDGVCVSNADNVALNDGLTNEDMSQWFKRQPFSGQMLFFTKTYLGY